MSTPLRARPWARYRCFGDGLCCTDIHAIGPLRPDEQPVLRAFSPELVVELDGDAVLGMSAQGRCVFLTDEGCALHARLGPSTKPVVCNQFPFGLVETPSGDRIVTSHRCPCRTLGDRPLVDVEEARRALAHVKRSGRKRRRRGAWPFPGYEEAEAQLIEELATGPDPRAVLPGAAFPELSHGTWGELSDIFTSASSEGGFGAGLAWFGRGVELLHVAAAVAAEPGEGDPPRPWAWSFERARARLSREESGLAILGDWAADEVWALDWVGDLDFAQMKRELACLVAIGSAIAERIGRLGIRSDVAHAEAVMVLDLATGSDVWKGIRRSFAEC